VTLVNVIGGAFLVFAAIVYVVVIAMCAAAGRADRSFKGSMRASSDMIIDLDGVARGLTPPVGMPRVPPPIPTPRNGVPVTPGGGPSERAGPDRRGDRPAGR
jgi:hypothetical protein